MLFGLWPPERSRRNRRRDEKRLRLGFLFPSLDSLPQAVTSSSGPPLLPPLPTHGHSTTRYVLFPHDQCQWLSFNDHHDPRRLLDCTISKPIATISPRVTSSCTTRILASTLRHAGDEETLQRLVRPTESHMSNLEALLTNRLTDGRTDRDTVEAQGMPDWPSLVALQRRQTPTELSTTTSRIISCCTCFQ